MVGPIRRFESAHADQFGFWGSPNSSVDWCERNYVVSFYIAEFWNTLSNAFLAISGVAAFLMARRFKLEVRHQVHGLAWAVVGIGSTLFHGTLWYSSQLLDELPMIYAALVWCYCLLNIYDDRTLIIIRLSFGAYAAVFSVLQAFGGYTVLFQAGYAVTIIGGVVLTDRALRMYTGSGVLGQHSARKTSPGLQMLTSLVRWHLIWLGIGFVCWISDQAMCDSLHALPLNPQLHAWWHTFVGLSVHIGFQCQMGARLAERRGLMEKASWAWLFYFLPLASEPPVE